MDQWLRILLFFFSLLMLLFLLLLPMVVLGLGLTCGREASVGAVEWGLLLSMEL